MKYKRFIISTIFLFNILVIKPIAQENKDDVYIDNCKRDILVLMMAYPDEIKDIEVSKDGYIYLVLNNDEKIIYDDKKEKINMKKFQMQIFKIH